MSIENEMNHTTKSSKEISGIFLYEIKKAREKKCTGTRMNRECLEQFQKSSPSRKDSFFLPSKRERKKAQTEKKPVDFDEEV